MKKKEKAGTKTTYHSRILSIKKTIIYLRDFIQTGKKRTNDDDDDDGEENNNNNKKKIVTN